MPLSLLIFLLAVGFACVIYAATRRSPASTLNSGSGSDAKAPSAAEAKKGGSLPPLATEGSTEQDLWATGGMPNPFDTPGAAAMVFPEIGHDK